MPFSRSKGSLNPLSRSLLPLLADWDNFISAVSPYFPLPRQTLHELPTQSY